MTLAPYSLRGAKRGALGFFNNLRLSVATALTAHAGGGKASALPLAATFNNVSTVANMADSVVLKPALFGTIQLINNAGVNAMQVFGQGNDTIDGVATATGVPLSATKRCLFICFTNGAWTSFQLGAPSA